MKRFFLIGLTLILVGPALAQTPRTDGPALERLAREARLRHAQNYQRAVQVAQQTGMPLFKKTAEGELLMLDGLADNGDLKYVVTDNNTRAAATVGTNQLWQGGGLGLDLTGGSPGVRDRLGIWEVGRPLVEHQEYAGRLTIQDPSGTGSATADSDHASHVSGTMIATGVVPQARGMANAANLRAWTSANDNAEMAAAATGANGVIISNHSYGIIAGWRFNSERAGTPQDPRWEWYGDTRYSGREDWRFGFYDTDAREWDNISYLAPNYLIVKSGGNFRNQNGPAVGQPYMQRTFNAVNNTFTFQAVNARPDSISSNDGYNILTGEANAKNVLVVAAVNPIAEGYNQVSDVQFSTFSSWGPTDDGRIKPDIAANGVSLYSSLSSGRASYGFLSGTSMAAPNASGSLFLLQEYYSNRNGGNLMLSSTVRGLAIHTANEAGPSPGPDYQYGWGLLNIPQAARVIDNREGTHLLREAVLAPSTTFTVDVVASGNGPLTATLCWTDPAGTVLAVSRANINNRDPRLVNDLDLRVVAGNETSLPWTLNPEEPAAPATRGDNIRDNVEKILVENTIPGRRYTIRVSHKGTLAGNATGQAFSLLVSGVGGREYCASAPASNNDSRIERVQFGQLDHTPEPACTTYSDFTNLSANVASGQTLDLVVGLGTCGGNFGKAVRAFADWNADGDFTDPGETIATSGVVAATGTFTAPITIPSGLPVGRITRLRLVLVETNAPTSITPCGTYPKGETRDYRLVVVRPVTDVAATGLATPNETFCANARFSGVTVNFRNLGTGNATNVDVTTVVTNAAGATLATLTGRFTGTLAPFQSGQLRLGGQFNAQAGQTYTFRTTVRAENDRETSNDLNVSTRQVSAVTPAAANLSATACGPTGNVILAGAGNPGTLFWYDAPQGGNFLGAGERVSTTNRPAGLAYYAALEEFQRQGFGPATKNAFPNGGYNQFGPGVWFSVNAPFVLERARLYIGNPGQITFTLRDRRTGLDVSETTIDVQATRTTPGPGVQTNDPLDTGAVYNLNILFPRAGEFELAISYRNGATIFRNNELTAAQNPYPIAIPGLVSLVGNGAAATAGTTFANFYYYFYDMTIRAAGCPGPRTEVRATEILPPTATIATSTGGTQICPGTILTLTATTEPGNLIQWQRNGANVNGAVNASYGIIEGGAYRVVVTNSSGCSTISAPVNITTVTELRPTVTVQGQVFTSSATNGNQWLQNGQPIPGATGQSFNAFEAGNYAVRVRVGSCDLVSDLIILTATEQASPAPRPGLYLRPNPAADRLWVELGSPQLGPVQAALYDAQGREISRQTAQKTGPGLELTFETGPLPPGVYLLRLTERDQTWVRKVIVE
ncbi:MAG: S8 family serine peptidase [Bernardetiaceae bacterium]|jgi:hypothetical protein|nr:S8 family serine peptidase [Bernardetiaceae bacterium]